MREMPENLVGDGVGFLYTELLRGKHAKLNEDKVRTEGQCRAYARQDAAHTQAPTDTQIGKVQLNQILPVGCPALQRLPGCLEAAGILSYEQAASVFPSTYLECSLRSHHSAWHPDRHLIDILSPGQRCKVELVSLHQAHSLG